MLNKMLVEIPLTRNSTAGPIHALARADRGAHFVKRPRSSTRSASSDQGRFTALRSGLSQAQLATVQCSAVSAALISRLRLDSGPGCGTASGELSGMRSRGRRRNE